MSGSVQMYDFTFETVLIREWTTEHFDERQKSGWEIVSMAPFSGGEGFYCFWKRPKYKAPRTE